MQGNLASQENAAGNPLKLPIIACLPMPQPSSVLAEALPAEQARVRSLIPTYLAAGFAGERAVVMMERDLQLADMALANGDAVEMLRSYNRLHSYRG